MRNQPKTILIINGAEPSAYARGEFNAAMAEAAKTVLAPYFTVATTTVAEGYDTAEEINKFKAADVVIYQYPVFWFMVPAVLKKYMDEVFAYDHFFTYTDGRYGTGGMMQGKKFMLSTTWNAPADAFGDPEGIFQGDGVTEALAPMRRAHFYCGFEELPHFSSHNIVADPQFETHKTRFITHLEDVFTVGRRSSAA